MSQPCQDTQKTGTNHSSIDTHISKMNQRILDNQCRSSEPEPERQPAPFSEPVSMSHPRIRSWPKTPQPTIWGKWIIYFKAPKNQEWTKNSKYAHYRGVHHASQATQISTVRPLAPRPPQVPVNQQAQDSHNSWVNPRTEGNQRYAVNQMTRDNHCFAVNQLKKTPFTIRCLQSLTT